jgi:hypothetical protein
MGDCRMMSDYEVEMSEDSAMEFEVIFHGPKDTLYEDGVWKVHVHLPDQVKKNFRDKEKQRKFCVEKIC